MSVPSPHAAVEQWMQSVGTKFCDVWFFTRNRDWVMEKQVDDHDTFLETVDMALHRLGGNYAMWFDGERWAMVKRNTGDTKTYPSREAAEMVAIHGA
jgi:hypothetical protein